MRGARRRWLNTLKYGFVTLEGYCVTKQSEAERITHTRDGHMCAHMQLISILLDVREHVLPIEQNERDSLNKPEKGETCLVKKGQRGGIK